MKKRRILIVDNNDDLRATLEQALRELGHEVVATGDRNEALAREDLDEFDLIISDLTEDEAAWLDDRLAGVAGERHRSAERAVVAADLTDRVFETMSPEDRMVLMLIDGEEASVKDVAELTGWSEANVKVRAFRARRRMREAVGETGPR